jgi:hypothetical protein
MIQPLAREVAMNASKIHMPGFLRQQRYRAIRDIRAKTSIRATITDGVTKAAEHFVLSKPSKKWTKKP